MASKTNTAPLAITTIFVDIGGVLLSDGWDHHARARAAVIFNLDWTDVEHRHQINFATYEEGKMTLNEYLDRTIFYLPRTFTFDQFREFMFAQSTPDLNMIELIRHLKIKYGLKILAVNNEARELNNHRIQKFKLNEFVDGFISSCFVHLRKPDADIFLLGLDIAQTSKQQIVYLENTSMFVQIAQDLGIPSILHKDYQSTCFQLAAYGLICDIKKLCFLETK
jgi:putative hydrolase of the HAD superfamily